MGVGLGMTVTLVVVVRRGMMMTLMVVRLGMTVTLVVVVDNRNILTELQSM